MAIPGVNQLKVNSDKCDTHTNVFCSIQSPVLPISLHKLLKLGKAGIVIVEAVKLLLGILIILFNENNYFKKIKYAC